MKKIISAGLAGTVLLSAAMFSGTSWAVAVQPNPAMASHSSTEQTSANSVNSTDQALVSQVLANQTLASQTLAGQTSAGQATGFAPTQENLYSLQTHSTLPKLAPDPAVTESAVPAAPAAGAAQKRPPLDPTDPQIQNEKMPAGQGLLPSAKQFAVPGSENTFKLTRPTPGGQSTGVVPKGLDEFYAQKVNWGSCAGFSTNRDLDIIQGLIDTGASGLARIETAYKTPGLAKDWAGMKITCGYVMVPVDYSKPDGPTTAIAVSKASTGTGAAGKPKHALFGNAGGPGQPSLPFVLQWALEFRAALPDYDVVAPDTRGAGASLPQIRCATNKFLQAQSEGMDGLASTKEGLAKLDQINKANTEACYTNTGLGFLNPDGSAFSSESYLPKVSVDDEARDMDVIRSVLGNTKLSYQGGSDGTGVGYTYAQEFPENTRAMILDSPENPFENNPVEAAKFQDLTGTPKADPYAQDKGFQDTFYQFATECAKNDGFTFNGAKVPCALGTEPDRPKLMAAYQAISQRAFGATTYYSESLGRPLSFKDFTQATQGALYSKDNWAQLNAGLSAAKDGKDVKDLFGLSDQYYRWSGKGDYPFFVVATFPTIACQNFSAAASEVTLQGSYAVAPFKSPGKDPVTGALRDTLDSKFGWCDFYHTKNQKAPAQSVKALPNILVVASSHDPATPYIGGVLMAKGLGATLLTVENSQHIAVGNGVECADQIAGAYLRALTVPTDIPGKTGIEVLDLSQRPIDPATNKNVIGDECRVDLANRPRPLVASASAVLGASSAVRVTATGLVRGAAYKLVVTSADGKELSAKTAAAPLIADAQGKLVAPLSLPASVTAGKYALTLVGLEDVNEKILVPAGTLTVTKPSPVLSVAKSTVLAGTEQTITGKGFIPGAEVRLVLHSTPVELGTVTADATGGFTKKFTVPGNLEAGAHTVSATSADGSAVQAGFQVTVKSPVPAIHPAGKSGESTQGSGAQGGDSANQAALANTGNSWMLLCGVSGLLILLLGVIVLIAFRRRAVRSCSE
ncbi:alpha/beta fold hydrolase [Psychromicrobium sp. YIM B11713]|uniref:alpha/beta fold hydrolase n=1 Tax=Psychromicrobium sp. YIM B11713 TaxID=3145233 RepID=UPI00374F9A6E